jgi:hypothetical protein
MMWHGCVLFRMHAMDYMELLLAALAAGTSASVVYVGSMATSQEDFTTLNVDMTTMTGMVTFVSMMIAQHPEWVV